MSRFRLVAICASLGLMSAAGCASPERYAPLTIYTPLRCRSLDASYGDSRDAPEDPSTVRAFTHWPYFSVDPMLGWQAEIDRELGWCEAETRLPHARWTCRRISSLFAVWDSLHEPSLRHLPRDWTVYRALYAHSLGPKVAVRAIATPAEKILIAKATNVTEPLGWSTVRRLGEREWDDLVQLMQRMPDRSDWYFGPRHLEQELRMRDMGCSWGQDGAWAYIERFENGKLQVQRLRYGLKVDRTRPRKPPSCSGACCDPAADRAQYEASLVVDHMMSLVQCAE